MYGDVQRVKILFNKTDSALVQYEDHSMALMGELTMYKLQVYPRNQLYGCIDYSLLILGYIFNADFFSL